MSLVWQLAFVVRTECPSTAHRVMSSAGGRSEGTGKDGSVVKELKSQSAENIKQITLACKNNLELQGILLGHIAKYERLRQKSGSATVSAAMTDNKKEKGAKDFGVVEDVVLERWMWSFKKWGPAVIQHLAMFCDEGLRSYSTCKLWNQKETAQQMLEFAWDIQVSGAEVDFVMNVNKKDCFQEMKKAYDSKGKRLQKLAPAIASGAIEWSVYGHYEVKSGGGNDIVLSNKTLGKDVKLPGDLVAGIALKDMRLATNWSLTEACLITKSDNVKCESFFPTLRRVLKRAASNEDPALVGRAKHQRRMQSLQEQERAAKQSKPGARGGGLKALAASASKGARRGGAAAASSVDELGAVAEEEVDAASLLVP